MIPVRGYDGHKVAVLGLGRSGLPAVAALRAGGAEVVAWDDGVAARESAAAAGVAIVDLGRGGALDGVKALIVSPGIPHLYPAPHPAVAAAWEAGVAVDNDIGLFFRSFATPAWDDFDRTPQVVVRHRLERQVDDDGADRSRAGGDGPPGAGGRQHRARRARPRSGGGRDGGGAGAFVLPDRAGAGAAAGHRGLPQPRRRPPRPARRAGRVFCGERAAVHPRRAGAVGDRGGRGRGAVPRQHDARGGGVGRSGDRGLGHTQAAGRRLERGGAQGLSRRVARRAAGRLGGPARHGEPARRAQPPERLRRFRGGAQPRHGPAPDRGGAGGLPRAAASQPAGGGVARRPYRQRFARRPTPTPRPRRWAASSGCAGSPAAGRRRAGSKACGRCSAAWRRRT